MDVEEEAEGAPGTCWGRSTVRTSTQSPAAGTYEYGTSRPFTHSVPTSVSGTPVDSTT